jgi:hypothetical protein
LPRPPEDFTQVAEIVPSEVPPRLGHSGRSQG